jgi:hypothetical protein
MLYYISIIGSDEYESIPFSDKDSAEKQMKHFKKMNPQYNYKITEKGEQRNVEVRRNLSNY